MRATINALVSLLLSSSMSHYVVNIVLSARTRDKKGRMIGRY